MANEKYVIKNPNVVMTPSGGGADVDFSNFMSQVTINLTRKDVDVSALGDVADRHAKGSGNHTVQFDFMHAAAMAQTLTPLAVEFASDLSTKFVVRIKGSAKGLDNIEYTFNVSIDKLPIGGQRDAAFKSNMTCPIDNQVKLDDGTTVFYV